MRLPDNIKECVCFLCIRWEQGPSAGAYESKGTGLLIVVHEGGHDFLYLVTAKHVVDWVKKRRDKFSTIYARVNSKNGGHEYIDVGLNWVIYDETKHDIDIALTAVPFDWHVYDYQALPIRMIATSEKIIEHGIGIGDDLFATGLFVRREGSRQNIPIVRMGTIAAMPGEPLTGKSGKQFMAYLIEMLSIGGLSGSPVYAFIDVNRCVDPKIPDGKAWMFFLLGIIRGHWNLHDVEFSSANSVDLKTDTPNVKAEKLNTGIAVVTPAEYIYTMLMSAALSKTRKDFLEMKAKVNVPDEKTK